MISKSVHVKARPACLGESINAGSFGGFVMDKSKFYGRLAVLAGSAMPFAVLAEGESGGSGDGVTAAITGLTGLQTAVSSYVTQAAPIVGTILASVLGITLLFVGWKLIKRATNKA